MYKWRDMLFESKIQVGKISDQVYHSMAWSLELWEENKGMFLSLSDRCICNSHLILKITPEWFLTKWVYINLFSDTAYCSWSLSGVFLKIKFSKVIVVDIFALFQSLLPAKKQLYACTLAFSECLAVTLSGQVSHTFFLASLVYINFYKFFHIRLEATYIRWASLLRC